eukprot:CAMPEP_0172173172 /NCGR_PEP_ID=MMETSP1050-20130122/12885_1 /TAXON_ID=233186 /ORGANISM="Cryptomonas curvata, Strain CCAP979/52" /LENGTH=325 /DNA_ID=CAMNT_0012844855 /DNA_START=813 /DNA_END=1791 /DNA_ORIENTATION=-
MGPKRVPLLDAASVPAGAVGIAAGGVIGLLGPRQHLDYVVEHELKESGVHIMICTASYLDTSGEERKVRQYFKFQVQKPMSVTTKLHFMQECLFLENQIQNVTKVPLHLDAVKFEPTLHYIREDLNDLGVDPAPPAPSPEAQVAAVLRGAVAPAAGGRAAVPVPAHAADGVLDPHNQRMEELGRLEMSWRAAMGEPGPGRLHSLISMQQWKLPAPVEVELTARVSPEAVSVGCPFEVEWRVFNKSDKVQRLTLELNMPLSAAVVPCGPADVDMDELLPREIRVIRSGLVALEPGLRAVPAGDVCVVNADTLARHPLAHDLHLLVE